MNDPIDSFDGEYRFLSNFWMSPLTIEGLTFPTAEHAYQAAKSPHERDWVNITQIRTAGQAKRQGAKLQLRDGWNKMRIDVMREILTEKFKEPELTHHLTLTGDRELIEGNHWNDTFWGVCKGVGSNHLGKLLMEVRSTL